MRKRGLIVAILGLLLFVVGCSKVTTSQPTKTVHNTVKSIDYTNLDQSQKDEMSFSFKRYDGGDTSSINMHVVNRTSKDVLFDGTKFVLAYQKGPDVYSTKDDTITIKSNSTKTVKFLFTGVDNDNFKAVGLFYYKNSNYKLAYCKKDSNESESSNLKEAALQKEYQGQPQKKKAAIDKDKKDSQKKSDQASDETKKTQQPQKPAPPKPPIVNADQAITLVESQYGLAPNGTAYTHMVDNSSGMDGSIKGSDGQMVYWIRLFKTDVGGNNGGLNDWTVYQNGIVVNQVPEIMSNKDTKNNPPVDEHNDQSQQ